MMIMSLWNENKKLTTFSENKRLAVVSALGKVYSTRFESAISKKIFLNNIFTSYAVPHDALLLRKTTREKRGRRRVQNI